MGNITTSNINEVSSALRTILEADIPQAHLDSFTETTKIIHYTDPALGSFGYCIVVPEFGVKQADNIQGRPCFQTIISKSAEISHLYFKSSACQAISDLYKALEEEHGAAVLEEESFDLPQTFVEAFIPLDTIRQDEYLTFIHAMTAQLRLLQQETGFSQFIYTGDIDEISQLLSVDDFPLMEFVAYAIGDGMPCMRTVRLDLGVARSNYQMVSLDDVDQTMFPAIEPWKINSLESLTL